MREIHDVDQLVLVVPADVPVVPASDYTMVLETWRGGVLAVAAEKGGTNGLLSRPGDGMTYHFGPDSLRRHRKAAAALGLEFTVTTTANWARDIDEPGDIAWLARQPARFVSVSVAKRMLRNNSQLRDSA